MISCIASRFIHPNKASWIKLRYLCNKCCSEFETTLLCYLPGFFPWKSIPFQNSAYSCPGHFCPGQWRIQRGFIGFNWYPLFAKVSSKSLRTMRYFGLDRTPLPHELQTDSDCSSPTSVFERFLVDYLPLNAKDDLEHAVFDRMWVWSTQSGRGLKINIITAVLSNSSCSLIV